MGYNSAFKGLNVAEEDNQCLLGKLKETCKYTVWIKCRFFSMLQVVE
jgi:hypothetical protein